MPPVGGAGALLGLDVGPDVGPPREEGGRPPECGGFMQRRYTGVTAPRLWGADTRGVDNGVGAAIRRALLPVEGCPSG